MRIERDTRDAVWLLVILALAVWAGVRAAPVVRVPTWCGRYVCDYAGVLGDSSALLEELRAFERETTAEVTVVTVPALGGASVEEFATAMFHEWGIGKHDKDNGVLVLVAMAEHKVRIEVGYGLEGSLPDGAMGSVIRITMTPLLREGRTLAAVTAGAHAVMAKIRPDAAQAGSSPAGPPEVPGWVWVLLAAVVGVVVCGGTWLLVAAERRRQEREQESARQRAATVSRLRRGGATVPPRRAAAAPVRRARDEEPTRSVVVSDLGSYGGGGASDYGGSPSSGGGDSFGGGDTGGGGASGSW